MSKIMRDEAIEHDNSTNMARHRFIGRPRAPAVPTLCATMLVEDCDHQDLNAAKDRCLGCGAWAHEFVMVTL